jgi:hypothetical protein
MRRPVFPRIDEADLAGAVQKLVEFERMALEFWPDGAPKGKRALKGFENARSRFNKRYVLDTRKPRTAVVQAAKAWVEAYRRLRWTFGNDRVEQEISKARAFPTVQSRPKLDRKTMIGKIVDDAISHFSTERDITVLEVCRRLTRTSEGREFLKERLPNVWILDPAQKGVAIGAIQNDAIEIGTAPKLPSTPGAMRRAYYRARSAAKVSRSAGIKR